MNCCVSNRNKSEMHYICPRIHNVAIAVERIEDVSHRGHLDLSDISTTDTLLNVAFDTCTHRL